MMTTLNIPTKTASGSSDPLSIIRTGAIIVLVGAMVGAIGEILHMTPATSILSTLFLDPSGIQSALQLNTVFSVPLHCTLVRWTKLLSASDHEFPTASAPNNYDLCSKSSFYWLTSWWVSELIAHHSCICICPSCSWYDTPYWHWADLNCALWFSRSTSQTNITVRAN